ncbi:MAG TPA: hypothetical protein VKG82_06120 [Solirubrobacteraceae bacterium]|nr:hypothetical protein [Solirubrobacteraceae bacterium]
MATRTIVTSQPDVACQVCGRRLLRGEQSDVFVAAERRLVVCELCAPRATHEGWLRESDTAQLALPAPRPRRGRSFLERLRQVGRPPAEPADGHSEGAAPDVVAVEPASLPVPARARVRTRAAEPADWPQSPGERTETGVAGDAGPEEPTPAPARPPEASVAAPSYVEQAVEVFNASEYPRRIAGVARSLGSPEVSVRSAEHLSSVVVIVVAWELCWYRYEVDLSDGMDEVRPLEQGSELGQLRRDDRLANALAADNGSLALAAGAL